MLLVAPTATIDTPEVDAAGAEVGRIATDVMDREPERSTVPHDPRRPVPGSPLIALEGVEKTYRMGKIDHRAVRFRPGDALRYA